MQARSYGKRVQRIFLTGHGRALEPVVKQLAAEVNTQAIAGFTTDEQVFLMRLLIRVLHNLEGEQGTPAARVFARYERYTK